MSECRTLWIEADLEIKERQKILGEDTVVEADKYQANSEKLAIDIEDACNAADAEGYDIISILPIDRGREYMSSFGYSITDGVILTARRKRGD